MPDFALNGRDRVILDSSLKPTTSDVWMGAMGEPWLSFFYTDNDDPTLRVHETRGLLNDFFSKLVLVIAPPFDL